MFLPLGKQMIVAISLGYDCPNDLHKLGSDDLCKKRPPDFNNVREVIHRVFIFEKKGFCPLRYFNLPAKFKLNTILSCIAFNLWNDRFTLFYYGGPHCQDKIGPILRKTKAFERVILSIISRSCYKEIDQKTTHAVFFFENR